MEEIIINRILPIISCPGVENSEMKKTQPGDITTCSDIQ